MRDTGSGLRAETLTFDHGGYRVVLVDPVGILDAAAGQSLELLHGAVFPAPVGQVRLTVAGAGRDGVRLHLLEARVHLAAAADPGPVLLGNDPLGVFLSRRISAGDPMTTMLVDRVGTAVTRVSRRLGRGAAVPRRAPTSRWSLAGPGATVVRVDPATGLRATVTRRPAPAIGPATGADPRTTAGADPDAAAADPRAAGPTPRAAGADRWGAGVVTIRAVVPSEQARPEHLQAMCRCLLDVVAGAVGAAPAGGRLVLSRYPDGRLADAAWSDTVRLDQIGGLDQVVAQFRQVAVSFAHPQVMARWGARRPQGILLYGPPGTGKTMLARALAGEIGATFREIRTPEILDRWLGGSERNIKRIFREARAVRRPTVLLFDEFDSIISYAGEGGDAASQAVNAVAGIFKQEMNDLIEENPNVVVVATTNFPHRVDESLVRSGRFDLKIQVPAPDAAGRAEIVAKMLRQLIARYELPGFRMFADTVDPQALGRASDGLTGADLREALRRVQLAHAMHEAQTGSPAAPIGQDDLLAAIADLRS